MRGGDASLRSNYDRYLVLTHGKLAEGLNDALRMIVGEVGSLDFLGLTPGEDLDAYAARVKEKAEAIMSDQGVLV